MLDSIVVNKVKIKYNYDANGNAINDGLCGFTTAYNELNLPKSVSKGGQRVIYTYDAAEPN